MSLSERVIFNLLYNPRSVVAALSNNQLADYWTSSGPYDEIYYYIEKNVADVRDDLVFMTAGEGVPARIQEYAASSMNLKTREEIYSAMVVYGFLSYENGKVFIPNQELMHQFIDILKRNLLWGMCISWQGHLNVCWKQLWLVTQKL